MHPRATRDPAGGAWPHRLLRRHLARPLLQRGSWVLLARVLRHGLLGLVQDLARQLDVVVGELADLGVVDAHDLGLLGRAQRQPGDQVHHEEDDAGQDEAVRHAGHGVGKLVAQLNPVVVQPAAGDRAEAVEMRDVVGCEEGGQDVADEAADGVLGEDIEGVVDTEEELELGGVVGA